MTDLNRTNSSNIDAVRADGVAFPASFLGLPATYGVTLASGTTYYFPVGAPKSPVPAEAPLVAIHIRGDAAIIATITVEDSVFPAGSSPVDGRGNPDVTDFDGTAGNWIPENPSTAIVGTSGTGWVATAATVAVAGGTAGGAIFHVGNLGSRRLRLKVVVGGTGGKVRVGVHGKASR
jgi:hypothetical protein